MFYWFLPCLFSFSGWCAGARIVRPVCFGLLWLSLCVRCLLVLVLFVWFFVCGVAGSCWPFVFAVVFSSVSLLVFAFGVWGCFGLARSLLASFPPLLCPPPRLVLWCLLVQSVLCWSLPLGIWLYLRRPGCHACGMVCCDGLAPVFTSPHGNKGFGPVWGSALYTMLRVLFRCPSFLH